MNKLQKGCLAEFIGTFALCFFGCASIVMSDGLAGGAGSLITIAMAHGIALMVFITATMYISGGQLNPAVAIGVAVAGKQPWSQAFAYIVSQLIAGACAVGMLVFLLGQDETLKEALVATKHGATLGSLSVGDNASVIGVFGIEFFMTFALMFVIFAAVVDDRAHKLGGLCIGLTVAMGIMAFGPVTGGSMNPARSLGPALYGHWDMHWVYWAGPISGAVAAALVYKIGWDDGSMVEEETD